MSTFWILAVNSWMQTPAGYEVIEGRFHPADWLEVVFSPSLPYRFAHTVNAFFITTAFVVIGTAAYFLRHGRHIAESQTMMSMGLWLVTLLVPLQIIIGDLHGLNTFEHQPAKVAAMEANWETQRRMPSVLFAIPDEQAERNRYEIAIPAIGSLYLTHSLDGEVKGLKAWPRADRPPVGIVFFAFRVMVGIGLIMLAVVIAAAWLRRAGRLYDTPWFLALCLWCSPIGFAAVIAGWTTTEVGRQPWVVQGLLRTRDSISPSLTTTDVATSFVVYALAYLFVVGGGLVIFLRMIRSGPDGHPTEPDEFGREMARSRRPLAAAGGGDWEGAR
jgi:cytochrome d ubiquinol oxidase subunit I